ncbi:hypothetical protein ACTID9_07095 [Brevibacillus fluminis]|uniref:hypothetical protein n=1 Tax=Brevibacillus fluminis TaxID=511487 RepID=UPI003F89178A
MNSFRNNKSLITVFCDASCDESNNSIGLGVIVVGMKKHIIASELKQVAVPDPLFGELMAVEFSLNRLSELLESNTFAVDNLERVIIYSDCDIIKRLFSKTVSSKPLYTELIDEIIDLLQKLSTTYENTAFSVKYIGRRRKFTYYKAAHATARKVLGKG